MTLTRHEDDPRSTPTADEGAAIENLQEQSRHNRRLAGLEMLSVISSTLICEWVVLSLYEYDRFLGVVPASLAFVLIVLSHRVRRESARDLGWRFDNFTHAARLLALPMFLATLLCLAVGWALSSVDLTRRVAARSVLPLLIVGVAWGLLQQYVLQGFFNRRAQMVWGRGVRSTLVAAFIFGALHLPNPGLALTTFIGGVIWAAVYQRAPNLPALALSHAMMTWMIISTLPPWTLRGLRVGFKYFG